MRRDHEEAERRLSQLDSATWRARLQVVKAQMAGSSDKVHLAEEEMRHALQSLGVSSRRDSAASQCSSCFSPGSPTTPARFAGASGLSVGVGGAAMPGDLSSTTLTRTSRSSLGMREDAASDLNDLLRTLRAEHRGTDTGVSSLLYELRRARGVVLMRLVAGWNRHRAILTLAAWRRAALAKARPAVPPREQQAHEWYAALHQSRAEIAQLQAENNELKGQVENAQAEHARQLTRRDEAVQDAERALELARAAEAEARAAHHTAQAAAKEEMEELAIVIRMLKESEAETASELAQTQRALSRLSSSAKEGRQLQDKFLAGDGADDMVTAALTRPGVAAERAQGVAEGRIAVQREMSTVVEQLMAERRRADASERDAIEQMEVAKKTAAAALVREETLKAELQYLRSRIDVERTLAARQRELAATEDKCVGPEMDVVGQGSRQIPAFGEGAYTALGCVDSPEPNPVLWLSLSSLPLTTDDPSTRSAKRLSGTPLSIAGMRSPEITEVLSDSLPVLSAAREAAAREETAARGLEAAREAGAREAAEMRAAQALRRAETAEAAAAAAAREHEAAARAFSDALDGAMARTAQAMARASAAESQLRTWEEASVPPESFGTAVDARYLERNWSTKSEIAKLRQQLSQTNDLVAAVERRADAHAARAAAADAMTSNLRSRLSASEHALDALSAQAASARRDERARLEEVRVGLERAAAGAAKSHAADAAGILALSEMLDEAQKKLEEAEKDISTLVGISEGRAHVAATVAEATATAAAAEEAKRRLRLMREEAAAKLVEVKAEVDVAKAEAAEARAVAAAASGRAEAAEAALARAVAEIGRLQHAARTAQEHSQAAVSCSSTADTATSSPSDDDKTGVGCAKSSSFEAQLSAQRDRLESTLVAYNEAQKTIQALEAKNAESEARAEATAEEALAAVSSQVQAREATEAELARVRVEFLEVRAELDEAHHAMRRAAVRRSLQLRDSWREDISGLDSAWRSRLESARAVLGNRMVAASSQRLLQRTFHALRTHSWRDANAVQREFLLPCRAGNVLAEPSDPSQSLSQSAHLDVLEEPTPRPVDMTDATDARLRRETSIRSSAAEAHGEESSAARISASRTSESEEAHRIQRARTAALALSSRHSRRSLLLLVIGGWRREAIRSRVARGAAGAQARADAALSEREAATARLKDATARMAAAITAQHVAEKAEAQASAREAYAVASRDAALAELARARQEMADGIAALKSRAAAARAAQRDAERGEAQAVARIAAAEAHAKEAVARAEEAEARAKEAEAALKAMARTQ